MPRWSVVMPVRDGEAFVGRAVSSVLATLPADAEFRVMDDASSDRTPEILAAAAARDTRVVLHRHDRSAGVAASLNELIESGDSAFVGRMDADDVCLRGRWQRGEHLLRAHDMAFMSILFIDASGRPRGTDQPGSFSAAAIPFHLLLGSMLVHPTAMMRRNAIQTMGGYRNIAAEDYDLWLRAATAGQRLIRSLSVGLLYRRHDQQVTKSSPWRADRVGSPMWESYRALAQMLEIDLGEDDALASHAMLDTEQLSRPAAALRHEVLDRIQATAEERLAMVDNAQLRWRLARERRRVDARLA